MNIVDEKQVMRKRVESQMFNLSEEKKQLASRRITKRLLTLPEIFRSKTIGLFASKNNEVHTEELIKTLLRDTTKTIVLPCVENTGLVFRRILSYTDLKIGHFGVREPSLSCQVIPISIIDVLVVPGLAFGVHGERLGRGKGYYDTVLSDFRGISIGICFETQYEKNIPMEIHDKYLNIIVSEKRIKRVSK
jgi:5-formyltetrahydrofolate cyclo-ligase